MKKVEVLPDQTIFDIATVEYGDMRGVFLLMEDNGIDMKTPLVSGQILKVREEATDAQMSAFLKANGVLPASGGGNDPFTSAFSDGFDNESFE